MDLRGMVLIGFSAACLAVAGLAYQEQQRREMGVSLAGAFADYDCRGEGLETSAGRVGCMTPVSFPLIGDFLKPTRYAGGAAMNGAR